MRALQPAAALPNQKAMPAFPRLAARALALCLPILVLPAASAHAWHGTLVVKAVNAGGDPADTFAFTARSAGTGTLLSGGAFTLAGGAEKRFSDLNSGGEGGADSWRRFLLAQAQDARYATAWSCEIAPAWDAAGTDGSLWAPVFSDAPGERRALVELRWWDGVAHTTTCTATNTRRPPPATLTVLKRFVAAPAGARVDLAVDGEVVRAGAGDGDGTGAIEVPPGTHVFGETGTGGGIPEGRAEAACADGAGAPVTAVRAPGGRRWSVDAAPGAQITCTITNDWTGRITIAKMTSPPSDDPFRPAFSFSGALGAFTLAHGESRSFPVAPGRYAVREATRAGSSLAAITCDDAGQGAGASQADVAGRTATVDVQPAESVTCTFANDLDGGPDTTSLPRTARTLVLRPASAVRGARLHGTTGACVSDVVVAQVRGKAVKRVAFSLDGRRVAYRHRTGRGVVTLRHPVRALAPGAHVIRAKVRFTARSGLRSRELRLRFTRCG